MSDKGFYLSCANFCFVPRFLSLLTYVNDSILYYKNLLYIIYHKITFYINVILKHLWCKNKIKLQILELE